MEAQVGGHVRNLNLRIQPLFETGVFLENPDPHSFEAVLREPHVLRLSNLATPELMVAVSRFVLQKLYADMLAKGPSNTMRVFAVVDEAPKLSYEETLTALIREARKYGVGLLLASQSVNDFDRVVFDMVGTKIALQLEAERPYGLTCSQISGVTARRCVAVNRSAQCGRASTCCIIRVLI
jgi:DNA phosphorothioation-dependent restriction protein DptH